MGKEEEIKSKLAKLQISTIRRVFKSSKNYDLAYVIGTMNKVITTLDKLEQGDYKYNGGLISVVKGNGNYTMVCDKVITIRHIRSKYRLVIPYPKFVKFLPNIHIRIEKNNDSEMIHHSPVCVPTFDLQHLCHVISLISCKGFIEVIQKV